MAARSGSIEFVEGMASDTPEIDAVLRAVDAICRPGSFLNGEERLFVARATREFRAGSTPSNALLPRAVVDAIRRLTLEPWTITDSHVFEWDIAGLHRLAYLEIVSVVARLTAVDCWTDGLGLPNARLPIRIDRGFPIAMVDRTARTTTAWVPTVGAPRADTALSALPEEAASVHDVLAAFYLPMDRVEHVGQPSGRLLSRPQIELIAARTSSLNECFY